MQREDLGETSAEHRRWFGHPPLFDPEAGQTVVEPLQSGPGWWAGACSALYEEETATFYLYWRYRKPLELGRGVECHVARSDDGVHFESIWSATQQDINTPSMERAALFKAPDGTWRLYLSFVDPADSRWRTDVVAADSPADFDVSKRQRVFTAADIGAEGVKDPVVLLVGGLYHMLLSYAPSPRQIAAADAERMHATADVYNTGLTKSHTGLAVSGDGFRFEWLGDVFAPRDVGWDAYAARIGSLLWLPPAWVAFYDGSAGVEENYEERTGLAVSLDLRRFHRVTYEGPLLTSPHASGSLRYVDALKVGREIYYYYEYARPDGSHELRLNVCPLHGRGSS
ncbi:MAG: hypothetical protein ACE5R4_03890 [Armatimonadota bacterium]